MSYGVLAISILVLAAFAVLAAWLFRERDYQLVIEFAGDSPEHFEKVAALKADMEANLISGEVVGNHGGRTDVNIFIITKSPNGCFGEAFVYFDKHGLLPSAAGNRDLTKQDYVRVWPKGVKLPFSIR